MEHRVDQRGHCALSLSLSVSAVALNPEDAKPAQTWRKIGMLHLSTFVDSVEFLQSGHEPAYSSWQPSLGNLVAQMLGLPRPNKRVARRSKSSCWCHKLELVFAVAGWLHSFGYRVAAALKLREYGRKASCARMA